MTTQSLKPQTIARGLALFIAGFCALNLLSYLFGNHANQNVWWIDFWPLPSFISAALQLLCPVMLLWFVFAPRMPRWRRIATATLCSAFVLLSLYNSINFYILLAQGAFTSRFPLPFSFLVCALFVCILVAVLRSDTKTQGEKSGTPHRPGSPVARGIGIVVTFFVAAFIFPLAQTVCFGFTDYRQPVDAVVVLGAQVYPNGTLSNALENRVLTAIDLYDEGLTSTLIMSGGIDVDGTSEALAMRDFAIAHGVPASAIIVDEAGRSTEATAQNAAQICKREGFDRVGAVSTFYHMPRIKQLFLAQGINVYTVPAQPYLPDGTEWLTTLREVPGWWLYWLKGLVVYPA
jgi:vancomycin permeability regulator SanA